MKNTEIENLIKGAYDLHIHAFPDLQPRKLDALEMVKEAREAGMAGCLLKDHCFPTTDRAYLLNKVFPDFQVFGAIVLNYPMGGLNPAAVEAAIKMGAKQVYMPTFAAANQLMKIGDTSLFSPYPLLKNRSGISLINENGALVPEIDPILDLIAKSSSQVILGTGHLSPQEIMLLIHRAKTVGVKRILVTHASFQLVGLPVHLQREAVESGALIEHSYFAVGFKEHPTSIEEIARQIREIGVANCLLTTDFGQTINPTPVEGLKSFVSSLLTLGFSHQEIRTMLVDNPIRLLAAD